MKRILLIVMFVFFLKANAQNPVQEFTFNGSLNSTDNTISFLGTPNFVNDRMGTPKGALRIVGKGFQGVVGELPQDNKPRTISVWVKFNAVNVANYIYGYGAAVNTQYFGLVQQPASSGNSDLSLVGWGDANNIVVSVPLSKDVWYQYSVTYDGNTTKIYRNGELLKSQEGISRATKGYILNLGKLNTTVGINADIDDLKLYSVAMTDEQVREAYNSSKPSNMAVKESATVSPSTAKKVAIVPVKASAPVAEQAETNKETKNIEVFSQGRKITGANASNIGELPEGTYLIKVTNAKK